MPDMPPLPESQIEKLQAMAAAAKEDGASEPRALPIDWSTEPAPVAANGVQVLGSPTQMALIFTDMVPFPGRLAKDDVVGEERARIVASLRLNPDAYFQMLCAMANNWNKFALENIDPRMRQPRFKLIDGGDTQLYGMKKEE